MKRELPDICPSCNSTRVLRARTTTGEKFFCPHCDHMWSSAEASAPRVLVVDDEEVILTLTNRALRNAGYDAVAASDGTQALDVVQHHPRPFDVFVLDVRMPHMTGDELAGRLRRMDPNCKVLYFTGFADQLFNHKSTLWANEAFIEKPASTAELLEAVSLLLYGHTHGPTPAATETSALARLGNIHPSDRKS